MAIRSICESEYMVRNHGSGNWQNLYINQVPTIRFGERFWHANKYLLVECDHRHEGPRRSNGDWKPLPALCVFRTEGGPSVHVGYLPLHLTYTFVEVLGDYLVIGNRAATWTDISWYKLDFTSLDALWIRKRFARGAVFSVPRLGDVPASFSRLIDNMRVPLNPLPRGDGAVVKARLFEQRLVMWKDDGSVLTQGYDASGVSAVKPIVLPPGTPGTIGDLVHCDGPYVFLSGSVRGQNDTVHQFYAPSTDSVPELLTTIDAPCLSLHTSGKSLFCISAGSISIYDVDLMDHVDDVRLPWSLRGTHSAVLERGNLAFAFGPSTSFPTGGLGVFNVLEGRPVGTFKFTERPFTERRGKSTFKGIVCDFADGPGYQSPWLTPSAVAHNRFFSSVALSNFRRNEWPSSRYMYWPTVVGFEFNA